MFTFDQFYRFVCGLLRRMFGAKLYLYICTQYRLTVTAFETAILCWNARERRVQARTAVSHIMEVDDYYLDPAPAWNVTADVFVFFVYTKKIMKKGIHYT